MIDKEIYLRVISSIIILPVTLYFIIEGSLYFIVFLTICFLISVNEWQKMKIGIFLKLVGIIFLTFSFYLIFLLRTSFENNYTPFLIVTFTCILTDIGGYVFGKTFRGPKLTSLSPNKTYAGVLGGYIFCLILYFGLLSNNFVNRDFFLNLLFFIFAISSFSQLGDILISYFKRLSGIKDTGNLIPGHGGLLDRIDGIIFAFPLAYLFLITDYFKVIV